MDLREKPYAECFLSPMKPDIFNRSPVIDELSDLEPYNEKDKPVFTGHYCYRPDTKNIREYSCLDGCVTCDKTLWGYRHQGTKKFLPLIW